MLVVSDEAYYEYVKADDYPETIPLLQQYKNLIVLRTFSKAYGLAALRVGYGVTNETLAQQLDPVRPPFNNTTFAHIAAQAALNDQAFIDECVENNTNALKQFEEFCDEHQLRFYPTETNFILIDFKRSGDELFDELLKQGYIVRSGEALGYPTCVRISMGTEEENRLLLEALRKLLATEAVARS